MIEPTGRGEVSFTINDVRMTFSIENLLEICRGAGIHVVSDDEKEILRAMQAVSTEKLNRFGNSSIFDTATMSRVCKAELNRRKNLP